MNMDTEIIGELLNCSLTDVETAPVVLEEADLVDGILECETSLFVKVHALKSLFISKQGFIAMTKAWDCKDFKVTRVSNDTLHVLFPSLEDKLRVWHNGPWCFDNHLILMEEWSRGVDYNTLAFKNCKFWMQIRGLRRGYFFTKEVAGKLSSSFQSCEAVELHKDRMGTKYFRLRADISIASPIRRLVTLHRGHERGVGYIEYERLPILCFHCGLLGHLIRQCPGIPPTEEPRNFLSYGLWIKAPMEKSQTEFHIDFKLEGANNLELEWKTERILEDSAMEVGEGSIREQTPNFPPRFEPNYSRISSISLQKESGVTRPINAITSLAANGGLVNGTSQIQNLVTLVDPISPGTGLDKPIPVWNYDTIGLGLQEVRIEGVDPIAMSKALKLFEFKVPKDDQLNSSPNTTPPQQHPDPGSVTIHMERNRSFHLKPNVLTFPIVDWRSFPQTTNRLRLQGSLAGSHEYSCMELPGSWPPPCSSLTRWVSEAAQARFTFSYRNQASEYRVDNHKIETKTSSCIYSFMKGKT